MQCIFPPWSLCTMVAVVKKNDFTGWRICSSLVKDELNIVMASSGYCHMHFWVCHTPTLEFHGQPPDDRKRQDIEFNLTDARMLCNRH
jgi:hypothetical protein